MSVGGWTVADTAQVARNYTSTKSGTQTPTFWSNNNENYGQFTTRSGGRCSPNQECNKEEIPSNHVKWKNIITKEEQDLDQLLSGLEKLTETLPDLASDNGQVRNQTDSNSLSHQLNQPNDYINHAKNFNGDQRSPSPPPRPPPPSSSNSVTNPLSNSYSSLYSQNKLNQTDLITNQIQFPSVKKTRQLLQSRDTYSVGGSSTYEETDANETKSKSGISNQPYHTLKYSKPFSYIRSNNGSLSMPSSRNISRASSREALNVSQPGLESPGLIRKVMNKSNLSDKEDSSINTINNFTNKSSQSHHSTTRSILINVEQPKKTNDYIGNDLNSSSVQENTNTNSKRTLDSEDFLSDVDASLSWLERQQRKLMERREYDRRRSNLGQVANRNVSLENGRQNIYQHNQAKSETTTDGYVSDLASMLYSETSTRENSPHKNVYNVPIKQEEYSSYNREFYNKTPNNVTPKYSSISRRQSDTSYDRGGSRPYIQRRFRYESESENELPMSNLFQSRLNGSNSSLDSNTLQWNSSQAGSRPITPAFPAGNGTLNRSTLTRITNGGTNYHHQRAPSPAGSLYQQFNEFGMNTLNRRGSVSSEPADVSPAHVKLVKDNHKFWYKPNISRDEAISMLRHREPGTFVVRDSNSFPGAFGLALKVVAPPLNTTRNGDPSNELIRHFLIEPTSKGVKLKGYNNEPVFASLSALVYQHTLTQLALPIKLMLPQTDLYCPDRKDHIDGRASPSSQMKQLLSLGAACNVNYLLTIDTDSLTGPIAVKKAVSQLMKTEKSISPLVVHFKVSTKGITLTDNARKRFFRRHFNTPTITFCAMDPDNRSWKCKKIGKDQKLFGFVAKKPTSRSENQCHIFSEQDPEQPARAIVNFVNKVMLSGNNIRSDVV